MYLCPFLLKGGFPKKKSPQAVVNFVKNEDGPTAVEYAGMLALIIVVCITAITALGTNANNTFRYVSTQVGKTGSCSRAPHFFFHLSRQEKRHAQVRTEPGELPEERGRPDRGR